MGALRRGTAPSQRALSLPPPPKHAPHVRGGHSLLRGRLAGGARPPQAPVLSPGPPPPRAHAAPARGVRVVRALLGLADRRQARAGVPRHLAAQDRRPVHARRDGDAAPMNPGRWPVLVRLALLVPALAAPAPAGAP